MVTNRTKDERYRLTRKSQQYTEHLQGITQTLTAARGTQLVIESATRTHRQLMVAEDKIARLRALARARSNRQTSCLCEDILSIAGTS